MKKAKIMLIAIAIIAIAGGALAFKARVFHLYDFCTTTYDAIQHCPNLCTSLTPLSSIEFEPDFPEFCYTAIPYEDAHDDATCQNVFCPYPGASP